MARRIVDVVELDEVEATSVEVDEGAVVEGGVVVAVEIAGVRRVTLVGGATVAGTYTGLGAGAGRTSR